MTEAINTLLAKYITGFATNAEIEEAEAWIAGSEENEAYYIRLYELWQLSIAEQDIKKIDTQKAFNSFLKANHITVPAKKLGRIISIPQLYRVAAVVLLALGVGYFYFYYTSAEKNIVVASKSISRKLVLPDSTVVWMNTNTELKWDDAFGKTNRFVYLNGEANFEINNKHSKIPFVLVTKHYQIKDIGTIFNVRSFDTDSLFEAFVLDGKIEIQRTAGLNKAKPIQLTKNERFREISKIIKSAITKQDSVIYHNAVTAKVDTDDHILLWKETPLNFDEQSLPHILDLLAEMYNIKISYDPAQLSGYKYTGRFTSKMGIDTILSIIQETTPINYEINGQNITVQIK